MPRLVNLRTKLLRINTAKKCIRCNKKLGIFTFSYKCNRCGKVYCSHCIKNVDFDDSSIKDLMEMDGRVIPEYSLVKRSYILCSECAKDFHDEIENAYKALQQSENVELVSKNYMGKKKHRGVGKCIASNWHRDKDECREELKRLAAFNSYSIVMDVETVSEVEMDGNYKYRVFRMTGKAYNGVCEKNVRTKDIKTKSQIQDYNTEQKMPELNYIGIKPTPEDGVRLQKVLVELNIGLLTALDYLDNHYGYLDLNLNSKITKEQYDLLQNEFSEDKTIKIQSQTLSANNKEDDKKPEQYLEDYYAFFKLFFERSYVLDTNICINRPKLMHDIQKLHQHVNDLLEKVQMQEIKKPKLLMPRTMIEELDRMKTQSEDIKLKVQTFINVLKNAEADVIYPDLNEPKKIPKEWSLKNADNRILNSTVNNSGTLITNDKILQVRARSISIDVYSLEELDYSIHKIKTRLQSVRSCVK